MVIISANTSASEPSSSQDSSMADDMVGSTTLEGLGENFKWVLLLYLNMN